MTMSTREQYITEVQARQARERRTAKRHAALILGSVALLVGSIIFTPLYIIAHFIIKWW